MPDALYHVASSGNSRNDIFYSDSDRQTFLKVFSAANSDYQSYGDSLHDCEQGHLDLWKNLKNHQDLNLVFYP